MLCVYLMLASGWTVRVSRHLSFLCHTRDWPYCLLSVLYVHSTNPKISCRWQNILIMANVGVIVWAMAFAVCDSITSTYILYNIHTNMYGEHFNQHNISFPCCSLMCCKIHINELHMRQQTSLKEGRIHRPVLFGSKNNFEQQVFAFRFVWFSQWLSGIVLNVGIRREEKNSNSNKRFIRKDCRMKLIKWFIRRTEQI